MLPDQSHFWRYYQRVRRCHSTTVIIIAGASVDIMIRLMQYQLTPYSTDAISVQSGVDIMASVKVHRQSTAMLAFTTTKDMSLNLHYSFARQTSWNIKKTCRH